MGDKRSVDTWSNWAGNHVVRANIARPGTRRQLLEQVTRWVDARVPLRVVGSGHSVTPLVPTRGMLLDPTGLPDELGVDSARRVARISAHTPLRRVGPALWRAGFALANQGDVDVQTVAGAISTGTKGSGIAFGSMSSTVESLSLIDGTGSVSTIDGATPCDLRAARVSLGLLGVVTDVDLAVVPRYGLREQNQVMAVGDLLERWDELKRDYRHFSFWWMPTARSGDLYGLPDVPAGYAYVKLLSEVQIGDVAELRGAEGSRIGAAHLVYPDTEIGDPFVELEYVVDAQFDRQVFESMRSLMRDSHPDQVSPLQVRWQRGDDAYLSAQHGRDSMSVSVSGVPGTAHESFLRDVHRLLAGFDARPHWGKAHFADAEYIRRVYPELGAFLAARERFDPERLFVNDHLEQLLGITASKEDQ